MSNDQKNEEGDRNNDFKSYLKTALCNTLDSGAYFRLDPQTVVALDLLPKLRPDGLPDLAASSASSSRSDTTVFAALNKCRTTSGQRLLSTWIANPLKDKEKIDTRLDIVKYFVDNADLRTMCYDDYLRKIPDLLRIAHKISREKCTLTDLIKIYTSCNSIKALSASVQQRISLASPESTPKSVTKLFNWCRDTCLGLGEFIKLIEDSIDLDNVDETGEYMVKPECDGDIAKISLEINSLCAQARKELGHVAEDIELEADKTVKLEIDADKGFALKVTKNNEPSVRGNRNYEQLSLVKKDGYRFTNRSLTKLSTKYVSSKEEYRTLSKDLIQDIISKATIYENEALEFSMSVTLIDVFVGLSIAAVQNNYVRPLILSQDDGRIVLDKLRHPCIENQPDVDNYVANDISLCKDEKKFYVITGPNMGGKSTFIKSVAIGVLMSHIGSLVPADDARISVIDGVYTRVGAGDKQMEGVSTFMEEMMDMSHILNQATENSIVIIDELGRGTSTFDGFGLAWSISKHLATAIKSYTLFATHFHELTELEEELPIVGNLHVKAICQDDKLTMLYNVGSGICDESYGINVAKYTQFPEHVVELAKAKLRQFEEVKGFKSRDQVREFVRSCVSEHMARTL